MESLAEQAGRTRRAQTNRALMVALRARAGERETEDFLLTYHANELSLRHVAREARRAETAGGARVATPLGARDFRVRFFDAEGGDARLLRIFFEQRPYRILAHALGARGSLLFCIPCALFSFALRAGRVSQLEFAARGNEAAALTRGFDALPALSPVAPMGAAHVLGFDALK